jgi:hypothetical protein
MKLNVNLHRLPLIKPNDGEYLTYLLERYEQIDKNHDVGK